MTDAKIYELPDLGKPVEPLLRNVIGEVLRRTRLQQHRTLKDVADAAQVSIPYLSEIERGRKEASSEVLSAVCRSLGIGLLELIGSIHRQIWERRPALMLRSSGAGGPGISAPPCPTSRPGGFGPVQLLAA